MSGASTPCNAGAGKESADSAFFPNQRITNTLTGNNLHASDGSTTIGIVNIFGEAQAAAFLSQGKASHNESQKTSSTEHLPITEWHLPYPNLNFIERPKLLAQLQQKLHQATSPIQPIVLSAIRGLGGVGKSQLASFYCNHPNEVYTFRAWFDASTIEQLQIQYLALASELGMDISHPQPDKIIRDIILKLEAHPGWLLIYDNAESYASLQPFLPKSGGHVLVTSRSPRWLARSMITVEAMEVKEAEALVRQVTDIDDEGDAINTLTEKLGYLPLAIAQASSYIKRKGRTVKQYLELYNQAQEILNADPTMPEGDKHDSVAITWKMNFEAVAKECPNASIILKACAFLHAADIPESLLLECLPPQTSAVATQLILDQAKEALNNYSLVKLNPANNTLSIHNLVQDVIRADLFKADKADYHAIIKLLAEIFLKTLHEDDYRVIAEQNALFTHFDQFLMHIVEKEVNELELNLALNKGGRIHIRLASQKNLQQAIVYLNHELKLEKKALGEEHPDVARTLNNLGLAYRNLGGEANIRQAIRYYELDLPMSKKLLGEEHPHVATTLNNLGLAYWNLGGEANIRQAISYYELALPMRKKGLGEEHPDVAATLNNLGAAYRDLGGEANIKQAINYYELIFLIAKKLLGEREHPNLAIAINNLGVAYRDLGGEANIRQAIAHFDSALKMFKKLLGENHSHVTYTLNNLGLAYYNLGGEENIRQAISYYELALPLKKSSLGEEHPEVANTLNNLGKACYDSKQLGRAFAYLNEALKIYQKHFTPDHQNVKNMELILAKIISADTAPGTTVANTLAISTPILEANKQQGQTHSAYDI